MPAQTMPKNSVWTAMQYTPPRGPCQFKASLMSAACPCLRYMLHPVKAATSFECDGCNHHASFHSMENAAEEAVVKKWAEQEMENGQTTGGAGQKRRRIAGKPAQNVEADVVMGSVQEIEDGEEMEGDAWFTNLLPSGKQRQTRGSAKSAAVNGQGGQRSGG